MLAAITSAWAADLKYRVSRVKARLKFMIDDLGVEGMRERVEEQLGRSLEDFTLRAGGLPAGQPPRHPPAERAGALLDRRARPPRPDLGRPADRDRRPRRAAWAPTSGSPASRT